MVLVTGSNLLRRIQTICSQLVCRSLLETDTVRYIPVYIDKEHKGSRLKIGRFSVGTQVSIGGTDGQSWKEYSSLMQTVSPSWFQYSVAGTDKKLLPGQDFSYIDKNTIQFKQELTSYPLSLCLKTIKGQLKQCYVLWAVYNTHTATLDKFSQILELPKEWIWKYNGAIQAAWSIKQNGANKRDVCRLLSVIGGNNQTYPGVYTYKDSLPAVLSGIHVPTDVGILFAAKNRYVTPEGAVPLLTSPGGTESAQYTSLREDRSSKVLLKAIFPETNVSVADYIFKRVWGPCGVLILAPSENRKDILLALQFIKKNTAVGTIMLAYTVKDNKEELLYPYFQAQQELFQRHKKTLNNGTTYKTQG